MPAGVEYVVLDILADSTNAAPAQILTVLGDPTGAEELLGGNKAAAMFEAGYREIVSPPSALTGYRQFFTDIGKKEHRPAVFHCTTSKDRTGWGAAALLLLLGVSEEDVYRDYLLTNEQLLPAMRPMIEKFKSIGGDPDLLTPVLGVAKPYLDAGITEMRSKFGTIEGYFSAGLGLVGYGHHREPQEDLRGGHLKLGHPTAIDILIKPNHTMGPAPIGRAQVHHGGPDLVRTERDRPRMHARSADVTSQQTPVASRQRRTFPDKDCPIGRVRRARKRQRDRDAARRRGRLTAAASPVTSANVAPETPWSCPRKMRPFPALRLARRTHRGRIDPDKRRDEPPTIS